MRNRVDAYCQHHELKPADLDIGLVLAAPNVLDNDDVSELAKSIKLSGADIFVVDTFAQVTPGANENSGEDMGLALRNVRAITEATGATALIVHHAGKDATRGARGWSGIKAAADAEIEISVSDSVRLIALTKLKDGDDSKQWGFRLTTVGLGTDNDGDPISSCVVEYVNGISLVRLVLSLTSRTNAKPARFSAGPCGVATKLRIVAAPVWYFTSSMRPNISGDISPPAKDRCSVRTFGMLISLQSRTRCALA